MVKYKKKKHPKTNIIFHSIFFSSVQFLLAELNTFYLKFVLWMPPEHYLVLLRLVFFVNVGGVAMREIYDFMDDP